MRSHAVAVLLRRGTFVASVAHRTSLSGLSRTDVTGKEPVPVSDNHPPLNTLMAVGELRSAWTEKRRPSHVFVVMAAITIALLVVLPVVAFVVLSLLGGGEGTEGAAYVATYTDGVDLHGAGTTEAWEIVIDLGPGITRGLSTLSSPSISVEAYSESPDLPQIEISAGPPIESGQESVRHPAHKWERDSSNWPIEIPEECLDGCRLVFPIEVTQLGEGPLASFDIGTDLKLVWETIPTIQDALGGAELRDHASIELTGPDRSQ